MTVSDGLSGDGLSVEVIPDHARAIVRIAGEIDLANARRLRAPVIELLEAGFERVLLDLRAVSYMDSTAIHALLTTRQRAQQLNAQVTMCLGDGQPLRILTLSGVLDHFTVEAELPRAHGSIPRD